MTDSEQTVDLHELYVAKGYCPAVDATRGWCCQPDGHEGQHLSLRSLPDNRFQVGVRWD